MKKKKRVEDRKPMTKEEIEALWKTVRVGPYDDCVEILDGFAEEHEGEDKETVINAILNLFATP